MQASATRWFLAIFLALAVAWPGFALAEAKGKPSVTVPPDQGESQKVEIIRRVKKEMVEVGPSGSRPVAGAGIKTAQAIGRPKPGPVSGRR